jgi:hypothetical protein
MHVADMYKPTVLCNQHCSQQFIFCPEHVYKACSKKDRTFAIMTLLLILQHFKHCPFQISPLYWRYTVPNVSTIVVMLPGTHFL